MRRELVRTTLCPNCGAPMLGSGRCNHCQTETTFGEAGEVAEEGLVEKLRTEFPGFARVVDAFNLEVRVIGKSFDDYTVNIQGRSFNNDRFSGFIRKEVFEKDPSDIAFILMRDGGRDVTIDGSHLDQLSAAITEHAKQRFADNEVMKKALTQPSLHERFKRALDHILGR